METNKNKIIFITLCKEHYIHQNGAILLLQHGNNVCRGFVDRIENISLLLLSIRMARGEGLCLQRRGEQHHTIVINVKRALF